MVEEDNTDKMIDDVQKDFERLIEPIKDYFKGNKGNQDITYLFLLTLTKNVNDWLKAFCNAYDLDHNRAMQKIVEPNENWEEYSKDNDKAILN
jgi:hypothetical protein